MYDCLSDAAFEEDASMLIAFSIKALSSTTLSSSADCENSNKGVIDNKLNLIKFFRSRNI